MRHILLGSMGEDLAVKLLNEKGYKILARNFRTKLGEIDIIAFYGNVLVFIEVKTRASTKYGLPQEAVNKRRISRIVRCGQIYSKRYFTHIKKFKIQVVALIIKDGNVVYQKIIDAL